MHDAAVVSIEGAELEGLTGDFDTLSCGLDFLVEVVFLDGAEVAAVHLDALGIGAVAAENAVDEVLQVVEAFAVFADENGAIRTLDLEAGAVRCVLQIDRRCIPEVPEQRIENFSR